MLQLQRHHSGVSSIVAKDEMMLLLSGDNSNSSSFAVVEHIRVTVAIG
jgi:hypothetical protein